jgi:hypothetical protein
VDGATVAGDGAGFDDVDDDDADDDDAGRAEDVVRFDAAATVAAVRVGAAVDALVGATAVALESTVIAGPEDPGALLEVDVPELPHALTKVVNTTSPSTAPGPPRARPAGRRSARRPDPVRATVIS